MDFDLSARAEQWRRKLQAFFDKEVLPRHRAWLEHVAGKGAIGPFMGELQQTAREQGLWNLGLPELADDEPGTRLSYLEYAPLAEIMGRLFWAPEVFNCQAPDVPNMIALQNCATLAQKERWLSPLLSARTRSAFGMTEPDVASSDATNIATKIVRDGDYYVISGRKWFITGAAHPNCSFLIVMGVTNAYAERTSRHSCMIVPMDAPGVRLVRRLRWMGCEDHVAPIGELTFEHLRVPRQNLLGAEGEGFKVAQIRLGPARIHHCMRSIGLCELLIELMMVRASERSAALDRGITRRARASAAALLSLRLATRSRWPSRCNFFGKELARRIANQSCYSGDAAADRRSRTAGIRRDGRLRRYADPSGVRLGTAAADRRRSPMRCICARSSAWRRCRLGRSRVHPISPRIPRKTVLL